MKKGYQIVIGAAVALALVGGCLEAERCMWSIRGIKLQQSMQSRKN